MRSERDAGENRGDAESMEQMEGFAEEDDREHRAEGGKEMQRESGGIRTDDADAAVPEREG